MQVILRPAAAADIEDAISWYDRQRPALGTEFLEAANAALAAIADACMMGGAIQNAGARVAEAHGHTGSC